jgi:hypothetical protein
MISINIDCFVINDNLNSLLDYIETKDLDYYVEDYTPYSKKISFEIFRDRLDTDFTSSLNRYGKFQLEIN